jgi:hypothetical protein
MVLIQAVFRWYVLEYQRQNRGRLHKMITLSKTQSGQRQGGWELFGKRIWVRNLVRIGLGIMVVAFFSGCGSSNTPEGAGKTAANPKAPKKVTATTLLLDKEGTNPVKMGQIKHHPESQVNELLKGLTQEEMDARLEADRKLAASPDTEIFPGMTQGEAETRLEADRKLSESPDTEIFPGMTRAQAEARLAAHKSSLDPSTVEVIPGMTQAQVEAQNAGQGVPDKRELFPPAVGK